MLYVRKKDHIIDITHPRSAILLAAGKCTFFRRAQDAYNSRRIFPSA